MTVSEIEPYKAPAVPAISTGGGALSFMRLLGSMVTLVGQAVALKEMAHLLKRRMEKDADDHDKISDMCAEAEVEPYFTGLITDAGTALREVANASGELSSAADDLATNAKAFGSAHKTEYQGIYEAVQAAKRRGIRQARPGFYRTR
ncbi:conjugal transfer protein TraB [Streptomyces sp. NPDC059441]|uniref:conjugal transfer protein TraB n=1 Tax=Streptomyces sp. NPDC059441 TaxID=3346829 RepID=UPI00368DD74D